MSNAICKKCVHNFENECVIYGDIHVDDAINICEINANADAEKICPED